MLVTDQQAGVALPDIHANPLRRSGHARPLRQPSTTRCNGSVPFVFPRDVLNRLHSDWPVWHWKCSSHVPRSGRPLSVTDSLTGDTARRPPSCANLPCSIHSWLLSWVLRNVYPEDTRNTRRKCSFWGAYRGISWTGTWETPRGLTWKTRIVH